MRGFRVNPYEKYLGDEDRLQREVIRYALLRYNKRPIPMNTESKKTPFERFKSTQLGVQKGTLDLFFPFPNNKHHGLFIELKKEGEKIYNKKGVLKTDHLKHQQKTIDQHLSNGYYACFCIGFDETKKVIDKYFNN